MSMSSLPPELLARIVSHVVVDQTELAGYSTVSRAWQWAIENHTFSHLYLVSDKLDIFEATVSRSLYEHRRTAVRKVDFSINLPDYDDDACGRFESQADRDTNNRAFSKALTGLFAVLKSIDAGDGSRPIKINISKFDSPMDFHRRHDLKRKADMLAYHTGKRHDLYDLRYRDSYIQLLDVGSLPCLYNVASLIINGRLRRKLAPAITAKLSSRLPNIVVIDALFWDRERRRPDLRRELRSELAKQLVTLIAPENLTSFALEMASREPDNSNFIDADVRGSTFPTAADDLSTALRLFSQAAPSLTHLNLSGSISISPDLFGSLDTSGSNAEQHWKVLEEVEIELSAIRPDGGWYTEVDHQRDEESSGGEDEYDEGSDTDDTRSETSSSSYDSSDSFFVTDRLPPDSYGQEDEKRDARLNGDRPSTSNYRTRPTVELEALFLAAASAITRMPSLKYMLVGLKIRPGGRTRQALERLCFEYEVKGVDSPSHRIEGKEVRQLKWNIPQGWRMDQKLETQWRSVLGEDGIVEYDEW